VIQEVFKNLFISKKISHSHDMKHHFQVKSTQFEFLKDSVLTFFLSLCKTFIINLAGVRQIRVDSYLLNQSIFENTKSRPQFIVSDNATKEKGEK
jgi:hypothetical protein